MSLKQIVDDGIARSYEYDNRTVFVADFGSDEDPMVDVVDDTVMIVTADGRQREIEVPAGEVRAFNRNGVVTVEVRQ